MGYWFSCHRWYTLLSTLHKTQTAQQRKYELHLHPLCLATSIKHLNQISDNNENHIDMDTSSMYLLLFIVYTYLKKTTYLIFLFLKIIHLYSFGLAWKYLLGYLRTTSQGQNRHGAEISQKSLMGHQTAKVHFPFLSQESINHEKYISCSIYWSRGNKWCNSGEKEKAISVA